MNEDVVTGSSRGIGAATALRLAQHGADVAINYVNSAQAAESVADQVRSLGVKAITVKADVSREEDIKDLFEKIIEAFGRVDIVFSNSGIEHFRAVPDVTGEEIDQVFSVNVKAQFFVAQQSYKHIANDGRLILMSSISAQKVNIRRNIKEEATALTIPFYRESPNMQSMLPLRLQFRAWLDVSLMTLDLATLLSMPLPLEV